MKKTLVISPNGMLGNSVYTELSKSSKIDLQKTTQWHYPEFDTSFGFHHKSDNYKFIINTAGKIKPRILNNDQSILDAIYTNSILPYKLVLDNPDTKIIQPLTDCEYKGDKGGYTEKDEQDVGDTYGLTKALATEIVSKNFIGLKVSIIGFETGGNKRSLVEWFYNLPKNEEVTGFENHIWNGISVNCWSKIVRGIIENNIDISGVQHILPAYTVNKYELLHIFKEIFGRDDVKIKCGNGPYPIDRSLSTLKPEVNELLWKSAGYNKIPTIKEIVEEMYIWYRTEFPERFR